MLTDSGQCQRAAETMRRKAEATRTQEVTITCPPDASLDVLDTARVITQRGRFDGLITRIRRPHLMGDMTVTIAAPWEALRD